MRRLDAARNRLTLFVFARDVLGLIRCYDGFQSVEVSRSRTAGNPSDVQVSLLNVTEQRGLIESISHLITRVLARTKYAREMSMTDLCLACLAWRQISVTNIRKYDSEVRFTNAFSSQHNSASFVAHSVGTFFEKVRAARRETRCVYITALLVPEETTAIAVD